MGSPSPTGPGTAQHCMDPVLQTSAGQWTRETEEAKGGVAVAEYVSSPHTLKTGQRGHWGALLARGNMTSNGGLTKGIVWWLNMKMGYGKHGFWHRPRENSKDKDMSHTMSLALLWQLASSCYFPFPGCLPLLPLGGTRRAISCYGQKWTGSQSRAHSQGIR